MGTAIRGLLVLMIVVAVTACEEFMGPSRPSRPARPLAPMVEVEVRRFDTLEWPLSQRRIQLPEKGILESFARLLRLPTGSGPVTGIEIRDFTEWNALWPPSRRAIPRVYRHRTSTSLVRWCTWPSPSSETIRGLSASSRSYA